MDRIELFPTLYHCIEIAAREEFQNSVNRYMEGGDKHRKLEGKIELLKTFLESVDFGKLRSQSDGYLIEGKRVRFVICWQEGELSYEMIVSKGEAPESH